MACRRKSSVVAVDAVEHLPVNRQTRGSHVFGPRLFHWPRQFGRIPNCEISRWRWCAHPIASNGAASRSIFLIAN
jgi:hypothetical protein